MPRTAEPAREPATEPAREPAGERAPEAALEPAIGLLEFDSVAAGIAAGDAMAKRAPVRIILAGTVHPGKYLVLVGGEVADVEEALDAGRATSEDRLLDAVFLPNVHPGVITALRGDRQRGEGEALGVLETQTVAAVLDAADAGLKGAKVRLLELRLADGLGGKGYLLFDGAVSEVEAAVELGEARIGVRGPVLRRVIAQLHGEMRENLEAEARFGQRARTPLIGQGAVVARSPKARAAPSAPAARASRRRGG